ncbi:ABC transporter substrate-binding protein [Streptomyces iconiensis]|uniref:Extracellular solute-binding protein n=1 Tax=Streptomyces iconiensis TaxID=1384038 RepID=A0ABT7A7Q9_9ACTN|nr:extracellular solute-binding protein [Streptomyces iconiensis]MDJ1137373.1 extracellular solute-binding protein [Streptomyces iconiensis]
MKSTLSRQRGRRAALGTGLACTVALALGACSVPGAGSGGQTQELTGGRITEPVTPKQVAAHGRTELRLIADSGDQEFLRRFVPLYEKKYPNVKVKVETKAFADFSKTIVNTMSGANPPDLIQGNQGYGVDGLLVQSGLLRPLDDVSHAYGWDLDFPSGATGQFRWSPDGRLFGSGNLYGISQSNEYVGVFYNRKVLDKAGVAPPKTWDDFTQALKKVKEAGELPIMLGNSDQYPGEQLLGTIQAQKVPVNKSRAWINGVPRTTFATQGNRESADELREWAKKGYLGSGYNGVSSDDAVTKFTGGKGAFLVAGSWNAPAVGKKLGDDAGFVIPRTSDGRTAAAGSFGLPWHISAKSDKTDAAVAFLGMMQSRTGAQAMADSGRLPVATEGVTMPNALGRQQADTGKRLLDDDGQTFYFDWASNSMLTTIGSATQDLLTGRKDVDAYLAAVQKDWKAFRSEQDEKAEKQGGGR